MEKMLSLGLYIGVFVSCLLWGYLYNELELKYKDCLTSKVYYKDEECVQLPSEEEINKAIEKYLEVE